MREGRTNTRLPSLFILCVSRNWLMTHGFYICCLERCWRKEKALVAFTMIMKWCQLSYLNQNSNNRCPFLTTSSIYFISHVGIQRVQFEVCCESFSRAIPDIFGPGKDSSKQMTNDITLGTSVIRIIPSLILLSIVTNFHRTDTAVWEAVA